jgi:hypothetical protein
VPRWFDSIYTLQGKNPTNTSYAWPLGSRVRQPYTKSLLRRNWGSAPGITTWLPTIVRPGHHPGPRHSLSTKPPRSMVGMVRQSSYWVTRFTRAHKPDIRSVQIKACHQGQNNVVLNRHRWGLPPWNLRITTTLSSSFPFECLTFPYLSRPVTTTYMNINIASTHHISINPSSSWKKGPKCEWDLPLFFYRCLSLSIVHLVDKHKYFYNKDDIRKGTTMKPITIIQEPYM